MTKKAITIINENTGERKTIRTHKDVQEIVNLLKGTKKRARMAFDKMAYDKAYAKNDASFKDPGCKHNNTGIYDTRANKAGATTHFKGVCLECGQITPWAEVKKGGAFTLMFKEGRQ